MKNWSCFVILGLLSIVLVAITTGSAADDARAFSQGQRTKYNSKDHPKAKGIQITLEYPSTWQAEEGQRPNIVQKFIGKDDLGNSVIVTLMIKKIPFLLRLFKKNWLEEDFLKEMVTDMGGLYISSGTTKIENENAAWVIFTLSLERAFRKMRIKSIAFIIIYKGRLIQLQCAVGGIQNDPTINQRFNSYVPLFQLIFNSIVFPDKWK